MYFILSRLDAAKFCKLDFIVNFGVQPSTKTELIHIIAGEVRRTPLPSTSSPTDTYFGIEADQNRRSFEN